MRDLAVRTFTSASPVDAPPVLLVHGFCSDGTTDWVDTGIAEALTAAGRTVVVPDLPGHGRSPAPATAAEVTAPAIAADLVAALDRAGITSFDAAGYSLGSRIIWELPAAAPGRVERTVLGGLSPVEPFSAVDIDALHAAVRDGAEPADPFTGMIAGMIKNFGDRAPALALCVEGLRSTPFSGGAWKAETLPVFVVGDNDELTRGINGLAEEIGKAELVTVPGAHHEVLGGAPFRDAVVHALSR
ncbi:alpha/beta hydrolase family protein [Actinomadura pelletieri DSM 43383]|uniref:Alpha/beta hydrolase family protein n=1 Tax=Actinomadura pelletieri DSM 43383 TaxID=1120940 RepID=A0A495Q8T3_9ACTN|nr:alpha/beta fold hydrolase [Actinomadura pelletieri]RKS67733.1 alpha/beta hydrolase family protein [Actinomadura pelletieri DSM 43383]